MDAKTFLDHFGAMVNAPGGIAKIRELILALATQGSLTAQLHGRTAFDLLDQVEIEKRTLVATRSLRRSKVIAEVARKDEPHRIPDSWAWVRFGRIAQHNAGKTLDSKRNTGSSRRYITTSNLYWGRLDLSNMKEMPIRDDELEKCSLRKFDLVICEGGEAGRAAVWENEEGEVCFQNHIHRARLYAEINPFYVYRVLEKMSLTGELDAYRKGVGISNMSGKALASIPIPLPPVEEQARIVAKVDELMALCDQLEAQQQARHQRQNQLRRASLDTLAQAESPRELQASWQRLACNFGEMFQSADDVNDLSAMLKSLAVRGLLAQGANDVSDLDRVKSDCSDLRNNYLASGLMRRQKRVPMAANTISYPENWGVTAFDEVAIVIGGVTKGRRLGNRTTVTCPYLAVANVQRGHFDLARLKSIEIPVDELDKYRVQSEDLLITEGGDWDKVGRTAVWSGQVKDCLHQNHVFKARIPSTKLLPAWVELVFNSDVGRAYFAGSAKQTTNLASINMTQLRRFPLPVPPFEEQQRILHTYAHVMSQCETLLTQFERKQNLSKSLSNCAIATLMGIDATDGKEPPMRLPKTKLNAPVRLGKAPGTKDTAPLAAILLHTDGQLDANDLYQRFGGEIDAFYAQLKTEVAHGWIKEPKTATVRELASETTEA